MAAIAPHEVIIDKSLSSREETGSSASNSELIRPVLSRRDTERFLDYYQSEDAGRTYVSSNSSYSSENFSAQREREVVKHARSSMRSRSTGRDASGDVGRSSMESVASNSEGVQRRTSQRSAGGVDKRRLAIVEVDSQYQPLISTSRDERNDSSTSLIRSSPEHNLLVRRGVDGPRLEGLALVAPPDSQLSSFTGLSPPPASAPPTALQSPTNLSTRADSSLSGHQRSMSDIQTRKKGGMKASPRDVGIVGTLGTMLSSSPERSEVHNSERRRPATSDGDRGNGVDSSGALTAPVFQTPKSRSPSPLPVSTGDFRSPVSVVSETSLSTRGRTVGPGQQFTLSIGQERDVARPVTGPIALDLSPGQPIVRRSPHAVTSGLPISEPPTSIPYPYGDRDAQRTSGRLPFKPNQSGPSYLHYQPGVHSTAGPLPSPPRHIVTHCTSLPPPRPPRLQSPPPTRRNEIDHTKSIDRRSHRDESKTVPITSLRPLIPISRGGSDFSITAVSMSSIGSNEKAPESRSRTPEEVKSAPEPLSSKDHSNITENILQTGSHVREGAFPASSVFLSYSSQPPSRTQHHALGESVGAVGKYPEEDERASSSSVPPSSLGEPPVLRHPQHRPNLKRENSWVSLSAESLGEYPDVSSLPSSYPSSGEGSATMVTTVLTSDDSVIERRRISLPAPPSDSRRFHSLPRTPSLLSITRPSRSQTSSLLSIPAIAKKAPSSWPDAMNFPDVLAKKSPSERAIAYAVKIHELAAEESGLREWLLLNARKERRELPSATFTPTADASRSFLKHPRHVSRGSMASEVTFPIRQDSYTATDLSPRPTADLSSPISAPSTLPYPSLAHGVGVRKRSSRTFTADSMTSSPAGSSRSLGGGFFASIGRKASIRKDRPFPPTSPTKLISSRQVLVPPQPRPVKIGAAPTLPGGPRAPARPAQRASSVVPKPLERQRPEVQVVTLPVMEPTPSFNHQVEKLSDLLPQADKDILSGYLRRAYNQDPMLAIGTYLEDEKQGCLRHD